MDYVGNKWYKCDFHLHTMQSNCYKNKEDTVSDWIKELINKKIDCIAITDHNDYRKINEIKSECEKNGIVAFPGVEVTCDTSKIHILVLFSEKSNEDAVRDFLTIIGIDSIIIDKKEKLTTKSVFEVCKIAKEKGGVVIAAHIDEYNGLGSMSDANLKKLINERYIDAVQVKNLEIWEEIKDKDKQFLQIKKKYGNDIEESEVKKWGKVYKKIKECNIPLLTFSDNPAAENDAGHGLWGIGKEYTWVKMGETATLEGFVQALLSYDLRIKTSKEYKDMPENMPSFWVKSISISNTMLNNDKRIEVYFNPHLNTIIGGRGSGKSSIIRLLYGAFKSKYLMNIDSIIRDQKDFYKKSEKKDRYGIFNNNSTIEIYFINDNVEYCLEISNIVNQDNQDRKLYVFDNNEKQLVDNSIFENCFLQVYPQKSIYEIAKSPDDLLNIIDSEIEEMEMLKEHYHKYYDELLHKKEDRRNVEKIIEQENFIKNNISNLQKKIDYYNKTGIKDLIAKRQNIINDNEFINEIINDINNYRFDCINELEEIIKIEYERINDKEAKSVIKNALNIIDLRINSIKDIINKIFEDVQGIKEFVESDKWKTRINNINSEYNDLVKEQGEEK